VTCLFKEKVSKNGKKQYQKMYFTPIHGTLIQGKHVKRNVGNIFSHSYMPEYCIIINMDKCFIDSMSDMKEKMRKKTLQHEQLP
jgi:hypothetical protein